MNFQEYLTEKKETEFDFGFKTDLDKQSRNLIRKAFNGHTKYYVFTETGHKWDNDIQKLKDFVRKDFGYTEKDIEEDSANLSSREKREIENNLKNYKPLLHTIWDKSKFPTFEDIRKSAKAYLAYIDQRGHG